MSGNNNVAHASDCNHDHRDESGGAVKNIHLVMKDDGIFVKYDGSARRIIQANGERSKNAIVNLCDAIVEQNGGTRKKRKSIKRNRKKVTRSVKQRQYNSINGRLL